MRECENLKKIKDDHKNLSKDDIYEKSNEFEKQLNTIISELGSELNEKYEDFRISIYKKRLNAKLAVANELSWYDSLHPILISIMSLITVYFLGNYYLN